MSTTLVSVAQDGNVFGSDVSGRSLGPVYQFSGAKIGYNPQDRFMVSLGYTLAVVTEYNNVFGSDVNGRNLEPVYQFNRSAESPSRRVRIPKFMMSLVDIIP